MSRLLRWGFDRASGRAKRPERLVRPLAYRGRFPIRGRTLAQVDADLAAVLARVAALEAVRLERCRANAGVEAAGHIAAVEPVSRPAGGRSPAATSEPMDVTAGETAPELISGAVILADTGPPSRTNAASACYAQQPRKGRPAGNVAKQDDSTIGRRAIGPAPEFEFPPEPDTVDEISLAAAEFAAALAKVREQPREAKAAPVNDWAKVAAAHKREAMAKPVPAPAASAYRVPKYQGARYCEQCDQRKWWPQAAQCKSEFCKIEGAA